MYPVDSRIKGRCKKLLRDGRGRYDQILHADSDEVDLESLLKIVNDISDMLDEEEREDNKPTRKLDKAKLNKRCVDTAVNRYRENSFRSDSAGPARRPATAASMASSSSKQNSKLGRSQRSFGKPDTLVLPVGRKNMSFSNESVREIDLENKRLLRQILGRNGEKPPPPKPRENVASKPSSSALNRYKRQQQIERDNLKFLKRLQAVKPTKTISRDYLLADHQRLCSYRPNTAKPSTNYSSAKDGSAYSMDEFHDDSDGSDGSSNGSNGSAPSRASIRSRKSNDGNESQDLDRSVHSETSSSGFSKRSDNKSGRDSCKSVRSNTSRSNRSSDGNESQDSNRSVRTSSTSPPTNKSNDRNNNGRDSSKSVRSNTPLSNRSSNGNESEDSSKSIRSNISSRSSKVNDDN